MEKHVKQNLIYLGVKKGDTLGVAVSGGIDSMVLLRCLCKLQQEMNIIMTVYHMEHGIRGQSSISDMQFVIRECEKLGVLCTVERADVPAIASEKGISTETAARLARYAFLDSLPAKHIATAHHMDDMAETVIMNIVRGSGLTGLCGIPEKRGRYIRPLLRVSRQEIEEYARINGIAHVQDSTNDDTAYTRNYIRKEILPRLTSINEHACANIARTARLLAEDEETLMDVAQNTDCIEVAEDGVYIDLSKFEKQKTAVKKRIIRLAISKKYNLKDVENVHMQSILDLVQKRETAKHVDLKYGVFATLVYNKLMIGKIKEKKYNDTLVTLRGKGDFCFGNVVFECSVYKGTPVFSDRLEYFDADVVEGAQFRYRKVGDFISPLGLKGTKRFSDYLSDRKIPLHKRDDVILLAKGNEIYWVVGIGISDKSKIKANSKVYQIKYWEN